MKNKNTLFFFIFLFLIFFICGDCWADIPEQGALDTLKNLFRDNATTWGPTLQGYATRVFYILAAIDIALAAIWLILNPGEFSDFTALLVRKTLVIGFFLILLQNGIQWANDIVRSLVTAGGTVNTGASNITPADIFETGYNLCVDIVDATGIFSPVDSLGLIFGGFIIMICFSLIAAMMMLVYVQAFIMINAGVLFLGFGGSTYTREIALVYFRAAFSVGAKLFVMILIVGLGQTILSQWVAVFNVSFKEVMIFIGAAVVLLALVKAIPDMVGDLINGFSWGSGEPLTKTGVTVVKGAVATTGAVAGATIGGSMAVSEAVKLAKSTGASGFGGVTKDATKNLAAAGWDDVTGGISGRHHQQGRMSGRMAAGMQQKRQMTPEPKKEEKEGNGLSDRYISPLNKDLFKDEKKGD